MKRHARLLVGAAVAAGILHAVAGGHLAALDPVAALRGSGGAGVVVAAVGLIAARLFLYFVVPAWAALFVMTAIARAIGSWRAER